MEKNYSLTSEFIDLSYDCMFQLSTVSPADDDDIKISHNKCDVQ